MKARNRELDLIILGPELLQQIPPKPLSGLWPCHNMPDGNAEPFIL